MGGVVPLWLTSRVKTVDGFDDDLVVSHVMELLILNIPNNEDDDDGVVELLAIEEILALLTKTGIFIKKSG